MTEQINSAELLKQKLEYSLDYLIEQLDENPMDSDAWQFYLKQIKDAQLEYIKSQGGEWFKQLYEIQPIPDIFKPD